METTKTRPRLAVPIKFKRMHPKAVLPEYKTDGAACVDLVITEIEYLDENKVICKFGFAAEIPDGYKVHIQPRSSFTHQGWVMANSPGIVDADYRGEWMSKFEAIPVGIGTRKMTGQTFLIYPDFPYKIGERPVQASIEVNVHMRFKEVADLSQTIRGEGGFGSTNK